MSYQEEHLREVVSHQLQAAIAEGRARQPSKLAVAIRREMLTLESDYPGTIEAAWAKLNPQPEYETVHRPRSTWTPLPPYKDDPAAGREAIAALRQKMGWPTPPDIAASRRAEAQGETPPPSTSREHGDVRGFARPNFGGNPPAPVGETETEVDPYDQHIADQALEHAEP